MRDKHPRRKKGDRDRPISITKGHPIGPLLDKNFTVLGTKMKSQKDKEVRAAFKSKKNRTEKQGGKAYRLNRASIGMILLIVHYHLRIFHFLGKFVLCIRPEKVRRHHS